MIVTGIVAEYNPLHNGHIYHIEKTKEITSCDAVIAVMSGNFVQRGAPALIDKWNRTKIALLNGIDLVLELPVIYSLSSAEFFAYGAVSLLNSLGIVNNICFGSENGSIEDLIKVAKILNEESNQFKCELKKQLNKGVSFPEARSTAIRIITGKSLENKSDILLNSPNNVLGIEYCRSILKLKSNIKAFTVKREGSRYNENNLNDEFPSATSIRNFIKNGGNMESLSKYIPHNALQILASNNFTFSDEGKILPFMKYRAMIDRNALTRLPDVTEGFHNRVYKYLEQSNNLNELISQIKTRRYTYTRICRVLCQYFIGFDKFDTDSMRREQCSYGRILGFNKKGAELLKNIKKTSKISLYSKIPKFFNNTLELDLKSTMAYSLINPTVNPRSDYLKSPIIID